MERLNKLRERRGDIGEYVRAASRYDIFEKVQDSEAVKYVIEAMAPIDSGYTKNTFAQGDRVKNQLAAHLLQPCDFEYQGSVVTDTHIKKYSDIDLLVLLRSFRWLEPPQVAKNPYRGSATDDTLGLRVDAYRILRGAFPEVQVDDSGATAIRLSGGSLKRDVDVVPGAWLETNAYSISQQKSDLGVKVFNKQNGTFAANTPFLHHRRIEERDQLCHGGFRKAVRLLKSLRADSDGRVTLSSYNIAGLVYSIPVGSLVVHGRREMTILEACFAQCDLLEQDDRLRGQIMVPDGSRAVFGDGPGATLPQLRAMTKELVELRTQIATETQESMSRFRDAELTLPSMRSLGT